MVGVVTEGIYLVIGFGVVIEGIYFIVEIGGTYVVGGL